PSCWPMFDDLIAANRSYASEFALAGVSADADKGFALVTCMDTRIEPLTMFGLVPGDAKIIRNAGGRVTADVLRSLVLAANFLGVRRVAVMHHTGCALAGRTEESIRAGLSAGGAGNAEGWEFLAMPDPDAALRHDVALVRGCKLLPSGLPVEGWRYDVDTGLVVPVVPASG
ncbi:MAG TPA: carbonic anhydrase, partial [Acidimicrobiales bacterium]|nr:carbonic anhydrase [Acidimicrobiales bacterium]